MRKQLSSVLIKPSGPDCNLKCSYCFYLEKAELFREQRVHRMSEEILTETIRQVMTQGGHHVTFAWQGGEPTLMGLPFFRKAVETQQRFGRNQSVGNGFQTNGVLLDEEWAKFMAEYHFLVGLSIDGPKHIHDHYRMHHDDRGSWQEAVDRSKMLLDAGVEVNALSVVNDYSVQFPKEIYEFHKSIGLPFMQFIPCVEKDPAGGNTVAPYTVSAEAYGEFLRTLFDCWLADFENGRPTTSIRYFDSVFHSYVGLRAPECTLFKECGEYVVVEHNGDVFACDFFVDPQWYLGNVAQSSLVDMLNSPKQNEFGKMKAELPEECHSCEWLRYCYGGCTKDRIRNPAIVGHNHFCRSFKMFFEHADLHLKKLANEWLKEKPQFVTNNS